MIENSACREFAEMMRQPDEKIDLAGAALQIARTEYPNLHVARELERLDHLASAAKAGPENTPRMNIDALNNLLFEEEQFAGNEKEYDDPRNSYLNDVLDRKLGIPITLSLVYLELAWRRGLPLAGVNFPGHFLVKYSVGPEEVIIDPYRRGRTLKDPDLRELLRTNFGDSAKLQPRYLAPATKRQILARMLNNLKGSFSRRRDFPKVLVMIEMALALDPSSLQDIRDRGMVYLTMRRYREAEADLKTYLSMSPEKDEQLKEVVQALGRIQAMMN